MSTKVLVVLRAGSTSLHPSWTRICANKVDVAISLYDDTAVDAADFVVTHRCPGGKFRGLQAFFADNAWVIDAYTHFWLMEDDLYLPFDSLVAVLEIVERFRFELCAPSLAPESFMSWPITVQNTAFQWRATDFVEIMAPIMSRAFLQRTLPMFGENHSGFGYEWLWRRTLTDIGAFAAILDAAPIVHTRPHRTGTLYGTPDGGRIDPQREEDALLAKHGIDKEAEPFRNLFGVDPTGHQLICGADFQIAALGGYASSRRLNPDNHERCRDFLANGPPPFATPDEIRCYAGSAALLSVGSATRCPAWRCAFRPYRACTRRSSARTRS